MTVVTAASLYRIRKVKKLEWGFLRHNHQKKEGGIIVRVNWQQVTIFLLFLHCLFSFIGYANNPVFLKEPHDDMFQLVWVFDELALLGAMYFMVRVWVAMNTLSSPKWQKSILLVFDLLCAALYVGVFITGFFMVNQFGWFILGFGLNVVFFATWYGVRLIFHLRRNTDGKSKAALRKLTGLVLAMIFAAATGLAAMVVNVVVSDQVGYSLVLEGEITYRIPYMFVIAPISLAFGWPTKEIHHGTRRPTRQDLEKSVTNGEPHTGGATHNAPTTTAPPVDVAVALPVGVGNKGASAMKVGVVVR